MKKMRITLMLIFFIGAAAPAGAWGVLGHRVIGRIAEQYIDPQTKAAIRNILGNESIAMASNWADFIKSNRAYDYLGPWHYVNLPSGLTRPGVMDFLAKEKNPNVYNRLQFVVAELKKKDLAKDKKVFYLRLLIHLAGDVHQPMHTGREEDRGGNGIRVFWFNDPTNLHRVWDEHLVDFQQLSYTEHADAINFPSTQEVAVWKKQKIADWVYDSYQASERLYADIKPDEKLSYSYNYRYVELLNKQLLKGGVRLAALLNEIF